MDLAKIIRDQRKVKDLSLEEVGNKVGVSRQAVHHWENAATSGQITFRNVLKLAEVLGLKVTIEPINKSEQK